jgi:hypothetical protein
MVRTQRPWFRTVISLPPVKALAHPAFIRVTERIFHTLHAVLCCWAKAFITFRVTRPIVAGAVNALVPCIAHAGAIELETGVALAGCAVGWEGSKALSAGLVARSHVVLAALSVPWIVTGATAVEIAMGVSDARHTVPSAWSCTARGSASVITFSVPGATVISDPALLTHARPFTVSVSISHTLNAQLISVPTHAIE